MRSYLDGALRCSFYTNQTTQVIANHLSKDLCLRACPDASNFTRILQLATPPAATTTTTSIDINGQTDAAAAAGSSAAEYIDGPHAEHAVYLRLAHALLSPSNAKNCIIRCVAASSTDNFPEEAIDNTLVPFDHIEMTPSYWSSGGQTDPAVPESLIYRLQSDLCLIQEVNIEPFKAFWLHGNPIFSAQYVRFQMGYPKSPLRSQDLVSEENEGLELAADHNYIWTYTSPEFPMSQENVLQSFKLPRPVLCIGGVVKIELLGRIHREAMDGLYYICVSHVNILGNPLSRELAVIPCEDGVVLKYRPQPWRSNICSCDSAGDDGGSPLEMA
ncbi:hypothetical protein ACP70R_040907 [Stipagrostis hirtigluma subsp. patula]